MKEKFLSFQNFLSEKWIPNFLFLFILSFYLLPSSKAVNNFFYIALLAPALLSINKLRWSKSSKILNFKALYVLAIFATLSLAWSSGNEKLFKEFTYIVYTVIFCQLIFFTLSEKDNEWFVRRLKMALILASTFTLLLTLLYSEQIGGRLTFKTRMDHSIQLASVTALTSLLCLTFITSTANKKESVLFTVLLLINLYITVKTGSRGPLLALILSSALLLIYKYKWKAFIPLSLTVTLIIGFIYYSLSGNGLQLSRITKEPQEINYTFTPKKDIESIAVRLGINGPGKVSFEELRLAQGKSTLLHEEFKSKTSTLPSEWFLNSNVGSSDIVNGQIVLKNTTAKNLNFYHRGIMLEEPIKEVTLKGSARLKEAIEKGLVCFHLTIRGENKKYKSSNKESRIDLKSTELQEIEATYTFDEPVNWIRPQVLIYGTKAELSVNSLEIKHKGKSLYKYSDSQIYDAPNPNWTSFSTGYQAKIVHDSYTLSNKSDRYSFLQSKYVKMEASQKPLTLSVKAKVDSCELGTPFLGALMIVKYKDGSLETIHDTLFASRFFRNPTKESRIIIWEEAIKRSLDHFLLGVGISSEFNMNIGRQEILHAHNLWVSTLYKLGLIGLALLGIIFFTKKFNILTIILIYSSTCAFFDTPDLFCSSRESWIYLLIPLITCVTFNNGNLSMDETESKKVTSLGMPSNTD